MSQKQEKEDHVHRVNNISNVRVLMICPQAMRSFFRSTSIREDLGGLAILFMAYESEESDPSSILTKVLVF